MCNALSLLNYVPYTGILIDASESIFPLISNAAD